MKTRCVPVSGGDIRFESSSGREAKIMCKQAAAGGKNSCGTALPIDRPGHPFCPSEL